MATEKKSFKSFGIDSAGLRGAAATGDERVSSLMNYSSAPDNPVPPVDERRRSADRKIFNKVAFTDEGVPLRLLGFHVAGTPRPADQHQIGVELNRVPTDAEKAAIWKAVDAALAAVPPADVEGVKPTIVVDGEFIVTNHVRRWQGLWGGWIARWAAARVDLASQIDIALTAARSQGRDEEREDTLAWLKEQVGKANTRIAEDGYSSDTPPGVFALVAIFSLAIERIERGDHRSRSEAPNDKG